MKNVLAGLGFGVALGMLLAPKRGEELRRDLRDRMSRPVEGISSESMAERIEIVSVLNDATREELLTVYGLGPVVADQIIQNRPYASEQQLIERNVVPESNFDHLRRQLMKRTA